MPVVINSSYHATNGNVGKYAGSEPRSVVDAGIYLHSGGAGDGLREKAATLIRQCTIVGYTKVNSSCASIGGQGRGRRLGRVNGRTVSLSYLIGVGPEQVAEQTLVGHVGRPRDAPDLLHALQVGRQAAVTAEDLLVDDGRHRQTVEAVGERLP